MAIYNKQGLSKGVKSKAIVKIDGAKKGGNILRQDSRTMTTPGVAKTGLKRRR